MNNLSQYAEALLPEPVTVLGRNLSPFCLGHALLLARLDSPFVTGERLPGLGDLLLATEICRQPWPRCIAGVNRFPLNIRLRLRALRCLFKPASHVIAETAILSRHVAGAFRCPRHWKPGAIGRAPGAPWLQSILIVLTQVGYTRDEALSLPMPLAIADYFAYWEAEGVIELMNESDHSLMAAAQAMREEGACPN